MELGSFIADDITEVTEELQNFESTELPLFNEVEPDEISVDVYSSRCIERVEDCISGLMNLTINYEEIKEDCYFNEVVFPTMHFFVLDKSDDNVFPCKQYVPQFFVSCSANDTTTELSDHFKTEISEPTSPDDCDELDPDHNFYPKPHVDVAKSSLDHDMLII